MVPDRIIERVPDHCCQDMVTEPRKPVTDLPADPEGLRIPRTFQFPERVGIANHPTRLAVHGTGNLRVEEG